jgi:crossover junction endodeoxyribonuclease RuvC
VKIIGIDPGTARIGWGLIEGQKQRYSMLRYGCIETEKTQQAYHRLQEIYREVYGLLKTEQPDQVVVEELFFARNVTTALSVGQARGVILLAAAHANLPIFEYTPLQVKQSITGYGRAEKSQIETMVKMLLKLKEIPKPDDAADALAIALTHGFTNTALIV